VRVLHCLRGDCAALPAAAAVVVVVAVAVAVVVVVAVAVVVASREEGGHGSGERGLREELKLSSIKLRRYEWVKLSLLL